MPSNKKIVTVLTGTFFYSLTSFPLSANDMCPTDDQMSQVAAYYETKKTLPAMAAQNLSIPEVALAGALPSDQAMGTGTNVLNDIWEKVTPLEHVMFAIIRDGQVIEIHGQLPPGKPSTRSKYYNIGFPEAEDDDGTLMSGHLRPDIIKATYAFKTPTESEASIRSIFFYGPSNHSDFGLVLTGGEVGNEPANITAFDEIWALIESRPRVCN